MTYWQNQPLSITNDKISMINPNIEVKSPDLPDGFSFKTLNVSYLEEMHSLLNNHYVEDDFNIIRLIYPKDFLYWYFKNIPLGFIVGLIYKQKIVGMISAKIYQISIYDMPSNVPFINFLCIQKRIRNKKLALCLIEEIKYRIYKYGLKNAIFTCAKNISEYAFSKIKNYAIPINYSKLKKIEFLVEDLPPLIPLENNPLHLMNEDDIPIVVPKLNNFLKKYPIKVHFSIDNAKYLLLPKKNIVYSFVNRNNQTITDFVVVYKNYLYSIDKQKMVSVANLAYYYFETMDITQLIEYLLDKLASYNIDQLIFSDYADNEDINITKFSTNGHLNYYFYNTNIKILTPSELCLYAF